MRAESLRGLGLRVSVLGRVLRCWVRVWSEPIYIYICVCVHVLLAAKSKPMRG